MPRQDRTSPAREQALTELVPALNSHSEAVVLFHAAVAESMGLDPTAYKALFVLKRLGPLSAGQMSAATGLKNAGVTDLIDRLVAKGYVSRAPHPSDRRRIVVTLVDSSVTGARRTFALPNPSLADLCERYDDRELEVIADFLNRNAQRLREDLAAGIASPPSIAESTSNR